MKRALLVDYGGVLTPGVTDSWEAFEQAHDLPDRTIARLLWAAYEPGNDDSPVALLERGELDVAAFEQRFAQQLRDAGHDVSPDGLVAELFAGMRPDGAVWDLVADVRAAGVPAVLVSNAWGDSGYPRERLEAAFDALVISSEVSMRKPERDIFEYAAARVDADLAGCVLIDDARANVEAAEQFGMTGLLHTGDAAATGRAAMDALGL